MPVNPISQFEAWLKEAVTAHAKAGNAGCMGKDEPYAMTLSTATKAGVPSSRMVLLRGFDERGFCFFTNYESHKGRELTENPHAALCWYWPLIGKQIRVEGQVEKTSAQESDDYFNGRSRGSQIGAWVSKQSQPVSGTAQILKEVAVQTAKFGVSAIPRPPFWGGFRVIPTRIEFWQAGQFRLHTRELFTQEKSGWTTEYLYP